MILMSGVACFVAAVAESTEVEYVDQSHNVHDDIVDDVMDDEMLSQAVEMEEEEEEDMKQNGVSSVSVG